MIEINLIPDVKQELLRAQKTRAAVISGAILASIIAATVVVGLVLYVFGVQSVRGVILDSQIKDGSEELSKVEDLSKILTIQNQLTRISQLNDQKKIDSRIFDVLSAVIPPAPNAVQVSQITISADESTIRLEGQTRGYDSMEVFKKTLDAAIISYTDGETNEAVTIDLASEISVTDTSYGANADNQKVLRFVLTFAYPEELFSPKINAIALKLSIDGNVTDSYLGIPKSIFAERAVDL
jgi:Tfp pilus assembly protein PilN